MIRRPSPLCAGLLLPTLLLSLTACSSDLPTTTPPVTLEPFTSLATRRAGLVSGSLLSAFHDNAGTDWVGGSVGLVLSRQGGGAWSVERVASTDFVTGIWGTSNGDIYVVVGNSLQRRDPPFWDPIAIPTGNSILLGIWGLDDDHAWIYGSNGLILYRDGVNWLRAEVPVGDEIWGIGGNAPDNLVAVGQNGVILQSVDGGHRWDQVPSPTTSTLFAVAANAAGRMVAVGSNSTVLLRDGDTWEQSTVPTNQPLFEVRSEADGGFLIAGNSGLLLHGDGISWQPVAVAGARENLRAIAGPAGHRIVAGWSGTILDEATGWGTSESSARIYGVHVAPDGDAMAVGEGGLGYRRTGTDWRPIAIPSPASLLGIDGPSANDRIAVGDSGTIMHYDGTTWQQEPVAFDGLLRSVWYDGIHGMIVGENGIAMVREGSGWRTIATGTPRFLRRVDGTDWNRLWVVGDSGTLLLWDGGKFARINVPVTHNLRGVYERTPADVWVVGDVGTILHLDRSGWTKLFPPVLNNIRAVHGIGSDIYIVGELGLAYRYRDGEWTIMATDQNGFWLDLDGRNSLVAVGENGTIAEGER